MRAELFAVLTRAIGIISSMIFLNAVECMAKKVPHCIPVRVMEVS
jgi:hypothetical protein